MRGGDALVCDLKGFFKPVEGDELRGAERVRQAVSGILFGQMSAVPLLIVFGVLLTLSANILSFSSHAYQAELYPTRIRALAVGFTYSWSRLSVVFSSFAIAFFLDRFGVPGVFAFIAGSMVIVILSIGILGPRTNNLALETISA